LTKEEAKRVKAWLYSISKTEYALENLKRALEDLETRYQSPPTWMRNPDAVAVMGGEETSKQETWVQFLEYYPARKSFLEDKIAAHERKLQQYRETLELMAADPQWGQLGKDIIRLKYYRRVRPDRAIYTMFLFCTEETFYRAHRRAIQFFYDVLPDVFQK